MPVSRKHRLHTKTIVAALAVSPLLPYLYSIIIDVRFSVVTRIRRYPIGSYDRLRGYRSQQNAVRINY